MSLILNFLWLVTIVHCAAQSDDGRSRDEEIDFEKHIDVRGSVHIHGRRNWRLDEIVNTLTGEKGNNQRDHLSAPAWTSVQAKNKTDTVDSVLRWLSLRPSVNNVGDSGHTETCGGSKIEISWTPKEIKRNGALEVTVDGEADVNMNTAHIDVTVKVGIISRHFSQTLTCDAMQQQYKDLKCPIEKGHKYKITRNIPDLSHYPLQKVSMEAEIKIKNENGELFSCLKAHVKIV